VIGKRSPACSHPQKRYYTETSCHFGNIRGNGGILGFFQTYVPVAMAHELRMPIDFYIKKCRRTFERSGCFAYGQFTVSS